jgi:hypothetical protein
MAQLRIPEEYAPGLAKIVSLPDEVIEGLTSALAESPPSLDVKAVTSFISTRLPAISSKDLGRILVALLSLYSVRAVSETGTEEFVEDVSRAMKRSRRPELALNDPAIESRFRDRLKRLLGSSALKIASKAVFLQHEHEHALCSARIFTDARPVYDQEPTSPPSAAVITHMLKLAYHEGNRLEEIHVALDGADLLKLKSLIDRAESKAAGLRRVFSAANIPVIE